jgi:hypothetical protein
MSQLSLPAGPQWPRSLDAYEYLRTAAKPEWAWECLRRNPAYRAQARTRPARGLARVRLSAGPVLMRLRARHIGAEAWGLCCFR